MVLHIYVVIALDFYTVCSKYNRYHGTLTLMSKGNALVGKLMQIKLFVIEVGCLFLALANRVRINASTQGNRIAIKTCQPSFTTICISALFTITIFAILTFILS